MPSPKKGTLAELTDPAEPLEAVESMDDSAGESSGPKAKAEAHGPMSTQSTQIKPIAKSTAPASMSASTLPARSSAGAAQGTTATCVLEDLVVTCEHRRKCNESHEIEVVPCASGESLVLSPVMAKGPPSCVRYELYDHKRCLVRKFSGGNVKIDRWHPPELRDYFVAGIDPCVWTLRALDRSGSPAVTTIIRAYSWEKDSISLSTEELLKKYLKGVVDPVVGRINQLTGKHYNLLSKEGLNIKLGPVTHFTLKAPQITLSWEGQWKEHSRKHKEWWKAYYEWTWSLNADPLIGADIEVDLAGAALMAMSPALMPVYGKIKDILNGGEPPLYLTIGGKLEGALSGEGRDTGTRFEGSLTAKFTGEAGIRIGREIVRAEAGFKGMILGGEIKAKSGGKRALVVVEGSLLTPEIKAHASLTFKVNLKIVEFDVEFEREFVWLESNTIRLVEISILPTKKEADE